MYELEREYNFGCILKILNLCHCILNKNIGFSETGMYGFVLHSQVC